MYQKCVCFLFLVILAVLSCSGFHIDSLAMADFSKKNFRTSSDKNIRVDSVQRPHKIRHHRLWRTQMHNRHPKPHIDTFVYPPPPQFAPKRVPNSQETKFLSSHTETEISYSRFSESSLPPHSEVNPGSATNEKNTKLSHLRIRSDGSSFRTKSSEIIAPLREDDSIVSEFKSSLTFPTNFPNENLAQIPPTDFVPVKFVVSRAQRSSDRRHNQHNNNKWTPKQSEDIFFKAYKAEYVVIAEVESKGSINQSNETCQCYVKVIKDFKGNVEKGFGMVNKYWRHMVTARCDLVREMINSRRYLLLLDDNLQLLDLPKPKEKLKPAMKKKINRVCKPGFVPTKPQVELKEVSPKSPKKIEKRNRILMCTVKGFPVPRITWRRKNEVLDHSKAYNVLYKRRQSKLVIKKPDAEYLGQYECVAESVNGLKTSKNFTLLLPQPNQVCEHKFKENFCQNGGTCFFEKSMGVFGCICPDNYSGEKCELKKPSNTSMYPQPDLYACNLGLSTKYNC